MQTMAKELNQQRRATNIRRLLWILAIVSAITIGFDLWLFAQTRVWQNLATAGVVALALALTPAAWLLVRRNRLDPAGYLILLGILIVYCGSELLLAGATWYLTVGGVLTLLLASHAIWRYRQSTWTLPAGLLLVSVLLINLLGPLPRHPITKSPASQTYVIPGIILFLVIATLSLIARTFHIGAIRSRLLISFVSLVLLPAVLISTSSLVGSYISGRQRVEAQLEAVAVLKESQINSWQLQLQSDLDTALAGEETRRHAIVLLQSTDPSEYQIEYSIVRERLEEVLTKAGRFDDLFLMDAAGRVALSTRPDEEGKVYNNEIFFQRGRQAPYVQPPFYTPLPNHRLVTAVRPVTNNQGEFMGILAGRANLKALSQIIRERTGLGKSEQVYLVDRNHLMLTSPDKNTKEGIRVYTEGVIAALDSQTNGSNLYKNYQGVRVVGVYRWLPKLQLVLIAESEQASAFTPVYVTMGANLGVTILSLAAAISAALFASRSIANPISNLVQTAERIAAGDLGLFAQIEREDEIGALAHAFNSMTIQLRGLIGAQEQRVQERTRDLEKRSHYLEAAVKVGRAATAVLDADQLINQVVELIHQRFDLYYAGLFLVDPAGEWAVLHAGAGADQASQTMLPRGHRVRIGEGMIGWSIAHRQARVAPDVQSMEKDAIRLATLKLPETRSAAAIPLLSRGRVLGALIVQDARPGIFDRDTMAVLQTVADQIAVGLDNAHLFAESEAALEAQRRAYGEFTRQAWSNLIGAQPSLGFRCDAHDVTQAVNIWRPEMKQALQQNKTVSKPVETSLPAAADAPSPSPAGRHTLAVPIQVRGNTIGVLHTYQAGNETWTEDETALLEAIAEQLGIALDNARLYQETQRRAAHERVVRQITEKIRAAADVDGILRTTVQEIRRALGASHGTIRLGTETHFRPHKSDSGDSI